MANLVDKSGDAYSNLVAGNGTNSLTFTMPGSVALNVESVVATIDNAAGGATTGELSIADASGVVIANKRQGDTIPSGDTGTATWALRLADDGTGAAGSATQTTTIGDISFVGTGAAVSGTGVTSLTVATPVGLVVHDLLLVVFAVENVAAASGPWVSDSGTSSGWSRVLWQAPAGGNGTGLEIWAAVWEVGPSTTFNLFAASDIVARETAYRNCGVTVASAITVSGSSAVAGNNPVAPSITTTVPKSWVVPAGADTTVAGFAYPVGYTQRWDSERGGVFGNAEATVGDALLVAPGATGTTTLTAAVPGGTARGATATVALNPLVTTTAGIAVLLGVTAYAPAVDAAITASNPVVATAIDSINAVVTFEAPASGNVLILLSALASVNNTTNAMYWSVLDGTTVKDQAWCMGDGGGAPATPVAQRMSVDLYVTGLTPGAIHGYKWAYRMGAAGTTGSIFAGPTFGRLMMQVWAAP